jgi:hypothetical protein
MGFLVTNQTVKHLVNPFDLTIKSCPTVWIKVTKSLREIELCIRFAERPLSHMQVVNKLSLRLPSRPLSYITWNTESRSPYLSQ